MPAVIFQGVKLDGTDDEASLPRRRSAVWRRWAPLLILDEPFTGLDAGTRGRISEMMEGLTAGKTVISLAHGPDALPGTDRVIHLMV